VNETPLKRGPRSLAPGRSFRPGVFSPVPAARATRPGASCAAAIARAVGLKRDLYAEVSALTRHAPNLFCDRNTTLDDFLEARVLLLHNCPNFSSQKRNGYRPVPMRESLESQIPDTAAYTEWLAIVCSIVVAALFCAVLFSNGLT
jgi:hypothetical protein